MNTTPWPSEPARPSPAAIAAQAAFESWRARDSRRAGVMARHAYTAGFNAGRNYERENS